VKLQHRRMPKQIIRVFAPRGGCACVRLARGGPQQSVRRGSQHESLVLLITTIIGQVFPSTSPSIIHLSSTSSLFASIDGHNLGRGPRQFCPGLDANGPKRTLCVASLHRPAEDALTTWDGDMRTYIGLIISDSNEDETPSMPCTRLLPLCLLCDGGHKQQSRPLLKVDAVISSEAATPTSSAHQIRRTTKASPSPLSMPTCHPRRRGEMWRGRGVATD
jgi:hypothetical protein